MRVGQPATIEVDGLAGEEIHGIIEIFSPGTGSRFAQLPSDNATGDFTKIVQRVPVRIRIRIDAASGARRVLVPGLSVSVSVDTRGVREDKQATADETKRLEGGRLYEGVGITPDSPTRPVEPDHAYPVARVAETMMTTH